MNKTIVLIFSEEPRISLVPLTTFPLGTTLVWDLLGLGKIESCS